MPSRSPPFTFGRLAGTRIKAPIAPHLYGSVVISVTAPHEQIPGHVFVLFVAREHGIRPDQVTRKHIVASAGSFAKQYGQVDVLPDDVLNALPGIEPEPHQNEGSQNKKKAANANVLEPRSETGREQPLKHDGVLQRKPEWDPERQAIVDAYFSELLAVGVVLPVQSKRGESLCAAACVNPADYYRWIKGQIKPDSVIHARIRNCCQTEKPHLKNP